MKRKPLLNLYLIILGMMILFLWIIPASYVNVYIGSVSLLTLVYIVVIFFMWYPSIKYVPGNNKRFLRVMVENKAYYYIVDKELSADSISIKLYNDCGLCSWEEIDKKEYDKSVL